MSSANQNVFLNETAKMRAILGGNQVLLADMMVATIELLYEMLNRKNSKNGSHSPGGKERQGAIIIDIQSPHRRIKTQVTRSKVLKSDLHAQKATKRTQRPKKEPKLSKSLALMPINIFDPMGNKINNLL